MAKYPNQLMVWGIGFNEKDPAKVKAVAEGFGARFPVLVDKEGVVARGYKVVKVPFGILVDDKGKIAGKFNGFEPVKLEADLTRRIQRLGAEQTTKAIIVTALVEANEAAKNAGLGAKLQQTIAEGLKARGIPVANAGEPSAYTMTGSVSKIGSIIGVSVVVSQTSTKAKMEELSESVTGDNYNPLLESIAKKVKALP